MEVDSLRLSVLIPVYNERFLIRDLLQRVLAVKVPGISEMEVVVVDDGSIDGTRELLRDLARTEKRIRYIEHETNQGKGAAVRTAIGAATGDLIVFQDADLEYDPKDYARLVRPFFEDGADVVYGSRFLPSDRRRVVYFRHMVGNRFLTFLSNCFTDLNLTDMETCYKMFRGPLLKSIPIRSNDFAMEPEITAKVAKRECRIFEVPISYLGRSDREGKKIGWRDGFRALRAMVKYWVVDDMYAEDAYGSHILHRLEHAQRFNRWMSERIQSYVGARVLEIGAGIGNITEWLLPRDLYVASDINPHYLAYLRNMSVGRPYLEVECVDVEDPACFEKSKARFDTIVCLNVLEHLQDPDRALRNMAGALEKGGRLLLYVPQHQGLYSSLDEVLHHRCRYSKKALSEELAGAGFDVEEMSDFNRFGVLGWWWNGKILKSRNFSRVQLKLFNSMIPFLRRIDHRLPWPGLGLIAVARRR
jgi:glycosyltransferase involved in cell wall biosynthesis